MCTWREKTPPPTNLVTGAVSHTLHSVCARVCVPLCVGCAPPQSVSVSPASAGSVWPAAHTPAGRCSDSDGPTAAVYKTHTRARTHALY